MWLRPPKARPMAGRVCVGQLAREVHRDLAGPGDARAAVGRASSRRARSRRRSQVRSWISLDGARGRGRERRGRGRRAPRSASAAVTAGRSASAKATTRISAPSSARMFVVDALGDQVERVGIVELQAVVVTRLRRIVRRVARSAGGRRRRGRTRSARAAGPRARPCRAGGRSRGEDELAAGLVQRVEGVEELLLGLRLACEELDVVDSRTSTSR